LHRHVALAAGTTSVTPPDAEASALCSFRCPLRTQEGRPAPFMKLTKQFPAYAGSQDGDPLHPDHFPALASCNFRQQPMPSVAGMEQAEPEVSGSEYNDDRK